MIEALIAILKTDYTLKTVTKFLSPTSVIRVSRQHKQRRGAKSYSYIVSVGKPNYEARKFIKLCQKIGEPFPVKHPQFKFYPRKGKP